LKHNYVSAERFILSREFFGMKLGLENISQFLDAIGAPQFSYPTIHLAGTNGKGSTASMIASVLQYAGYKTGLFTSPHLVSLRERIRVNGRLIPRPSVTAFVDRYRRELDRRKLSFFEVITAMALYYFRQAGVDIAVIETGLGGRLDATNVLAPLLTITTDISRDHVEILGYSLKKIAFEKAGIIKPATPHLIGLLPPEAEEVMRRRCRLLGTRLHKLSRSNFVAHSDCGRLDFTWNGCHLTKVEPSLYGPHQLSNAALALKSLVIIDALGVKVSRSAMRTGLRTVDWPGRFQIVRHRGQPTIILDVCHNAGGVAAFVDAFKRRFGDRRAHVVTGFVRRKPHQEMFNLLGGIAEEFHLVPLKTHRRTDLSTLLAQTDFHGVPVRRCRSLRSALDRLLKSCRRDDIIVVAGSHYLVGEYLEKFG